MKFCIAKIEPDLLDIRIFKNASIEVRSLNQKTISAKKSQSKAVEKQKYIILTNDGNKIHILIQNVPTVPVKSEDQNSFKNNNTRL